MRADGLPQHYQRSTRSERILQLPESVSADVILVGILFCFEFCVFAERKLFFIRIVYLFFRVGARKELKEEGCMIGSKEAEICFVLFHGVVYLHLAGGLIFWRVDRSIARSFPEGNVTTRQDAALVAAPMDLVVGRVCGRPPVGASISLCPPASWEAIVGLFLRPNLRVCFDAYRLVAYGTYTLRHPTSRNPLSYLSGFVSFRALGFLVLCLSG